MSIVENLIEKQDEPETPVSVNIPEQDKNKPILIQYVVFNGKLYKELKSKYYSSCTFLVDYFKNDIKDDINDVWCEYDFQIKENEMIQKGLYNTTYEFNQNRYKMYLEKRIVHPKQTSEKELFTLHKVILKALIVSYMSNKRNKTLIKSREELHKSNIFNIIKLKISTISSLIYEEALKGQDHIRVSFDISECNITFEKIDYTIPNSDDKVRPNLIQYVAFLLKDTMEKDLEQPMEEMCEKEFGEQWILKKVQSLYPHLDIEICNPGKVFPTLQIKFADLSDCML